MQLRKFFVYRAVGITAILVIVLVFNYFHPKAGRVQKNGTDNTTTSSPVAEEPMRDQLARCLPLSDMDSKRKCDALLATINSFEGCLAAGFEIEKTNPEQCSLPDGRVLKATREKTTLVGKFICLPHRDASGPQTLECAMGLASDGVNYALDSSLLGKYLDYPTGAELKISGYIIPIEELNSDVWQKYDVKGILQVTVASDATK